MPCVTDTVVGEAAIVKVGGAETVRLTTVVCWTPPPLPVTVMEYVPVGVEAPTVMVIVEVPDPGAGMVVGLNVTEVPEGTPDADKLIELLKPLLLVVVTVDEP